MDIHIGPLHSADYPQAIEVIIRSITLSQGKIYPAELIGEFITKYELERFKQKAIDIEYFVAKDSDTQKLHGIIGLKGNEVRTFFVDPSAQGKGIGRKLYDFLEQRARKKGVTKLILEGSPLGEPVYKKFGFRKVKTIHKERNGMPYTDAYMEKKLT